jgi:cytoskeletal protein RodZ
MTLELGTTSLSQARLARGLTLEDAERGTRISRKFLIALEEHDYSVFPAPVYARGFLRTYCRYLGVNPERQLAELPAGWAASTPTTHLPPISHGPMQFNLAWIVAGAVLAAIVGLGVFLSQDGQDLGQLQEEGLAQLQGEQTAVAGNTGAGAGGERSQVSVEPTEVSESPGRALDAGLPGILPDFQDVRVSEAMTFLTQQGIAYLRIDAASESMPAGLVMSQSPAAGAGTDGLSQVTLTVSAGPTVGEARTDCSVLESTNRRTQAEQAYYEQNCGPAAELGDRTTCEEIRGTDYRSPAERTFFLANCVTQ